VTRARLLALAAALAAVVVVAAVLISEGGADEDEEPAPRAQRSTETIPQDGIWLGDPNAPATLIEFADLQCPFCAEFANDELPRVIDSYVRDRQVRLELRLLAFLGPDSAKGRQWAHAAALQDRMWGFTDRFFGNQGAENSGYATDEFLEGLVRDTPGLDVGQLMSDLGNQEVEALNRQADRLAEQLGVQGTPSFYLVRDGGRPEPVEIGELDSALGG
jgi:protein-disulfide isomerase